ncbi:MAG: hypothetical protein ACRDTT_27405 [Pseudonocardiaceae bacterium]
MIEVRIRHHTDTDPVHLCTWPATELVTLIPMLRVWGVTHLGTGDEVGGALGDLSGGVVVDVTEAYFQVVHGG